MTNPKEMSTAELKQLLAQKEKEEKQQLEKERIGYEKARNESVRDGVAAAEVLSKAMLDFKAEIDLMMNEQEVKLSEYGLIPKKSKGGFTIKDSTDSMRITRVRSTEPSWDERGDKAVELIRDFLFTTVKKMNKNLFEILLSFIERNNKHELEYSKVMLLLSHEDKFDAPEWKEGLRLLKQSHSINLKKFHYEFRVKDKQGNFQRVNLNFSAI